MMIILSIYLPLFVWSSLHWNKIYPRYERCFNECYQEITEMMKKGFDFWTPTTCAERCREKIAYEDYKKMIE